MNRIVLFLCVFLMSSPALADYFSWEDSKSGLTLTFPDTWKVQNNRHPDTILTIKAPSQNADPVCKVKAEDDGRYTIFPPQYGDVVQKDAVSIPFWESYLGHYDDYDIARVYDGGGLGRWVASYATASYNERDGSILKSRRGIMFASLYYNTLYTVECSSLAHSYEDWARNFQSVIKSIDFEKIYHLRRHGHYDDFLSDAEMNFWAQTGPEGTISYN